MFSVGIRLQREMREKWLLFFWSQPLFSPGFKREEVLKVTNHETLCDGSGKQISGGGQVKKKKKVILLKIKLFLNILLTRNKACGIRFHIIWTRYDSQVRKQAAFLKMSNMKISCKTYNKWNNFLIVKTNAKMK